MINSNIGLLMTRMCRSSVAFCLLRLYTTWSRCNMFSNGPFFSMWSTSNSAVRMYMFCVDHALGVDRILFALMVRMCALKRILNVRPICPIYFNGHPLHCSW